MEESPSAVAGQPALPLKDEVVQVGLAGGGALSRWELCRFVVVHANSSIYSVRIYISVYAARKIKCVRLRKTFPAKKVR